MPCPAGADRAPSRGREGGKEGEGEGKPGEGRREGERAGKRGGCRGRWWSQHPQPRLRCGMEFHRPLMKGQPVALRSRLVKIGCALVVAAFALAGCAGQPGAAAVVDGRAITERSLSEATTELTEVLGGAASPAAILEVMIQAPFAVQVASEHGVAISTDEASDVLDAEVEARGDQPPADGYGEEALSVARYLFLLGMIEQSPEGQQIMTELGERLQEVQVQLSPRYGDWNAEQAMVEQAPPEWLEVSESQLEAEQAPVG